MLLLIATSPSDPEFLARALQHATTFDGTEGETRVVNPKVVAVK